MSQHSELNPTAGLVERAASGDTVAITVLLTFVRGRLRTHFERRIPRDLQSCVDVDDLLQETQIQVFHHIRTFQSTGPDSFYRWVATIGMHRLRNLIKAQRAQKRGRARTISSQGGNNDGSNTSLLEWLMGPENTPSQHAARNEATDALAVALAHLPEHYRQAIRLVYIEGRSVAEAARIMGRSARAVHNLCYKAKEQLHLSLGSTSRFFSKS
jgi:RNA polymerase sigma-70 factor (subfamily 1)